MSILPWHRKLHPHHYPELEIEFGGGAKGPASGALSGSFPAPSVKHMNLTPTTVAVGEGAVATHSGAICLGPGCISNASASVNIASVNTVQATPVACSHRLVVNINGTLYYLMLALV